ncbi:hypothetical protein WA538_003015, partial [Blastocystis sp. DL]
MASDDRHHSSRSRHSHYHSDSHRSRSRDSHRSRDYDRHRSSHRSGSRHDSHRDSHRERSRANEKRSVSRAAVDQGSKGQSSVRYETFQKGSSNSTTSGSSSVPALPTISLSLNEGKTQEVKPVVSLFDAPSTTPSQPKKEEPRPLVSRYEAKNDKKAKMEEEEDPLDAFMRGIEEETKKGVVESLKQDYENGQKHMEEEARKEEEAKAAAEPPPPVITLDQILDDHKEQAEEQKMDLDDDKYHEEFKQALQKQQAEEEEREKKARTDRLIDQGLGYTEMQDDYVEEYMDQETELTALEQLQKKIQRKILEPVDHSQINYIPIRKNFYIESPLITKMTEEEVAAIRKQWRMVIRGKHYPRPILTWSQCGLNEKIMHVITKLGYEKPFPIQSQAIPTIMSGRECIAVAKTGSGKTLAYLLPLFRHILDQPPVKEGEGPIGLIFAPARELVAQIYTEASKFCKILGIRITAVYGGTSMTEQINSLKRGSEIIVCTPGRMIDILCLNQGRLVGLQRVSYIVLDEADRMLDMGFEPQISRIVENARPDRQLVMFSATFPSHVENLARRILNKPVMIIVGGRTEVAAEVAQTIEVRTKEQKFPRLLQILGEWYDKGLILIFVDKQQKADYLFRDLLRSGYYSFTLHGGMDQQDRDQTIADFKNKTRTILIATSVAGRGLHVNDLVLVINYDCPNHLEDYVHRVGRTGRAGHKGNAITFITPQEDMYAEDMVRALKESKTPVPPELEKLAESFEEKVKAGSAKHRRSGYHTKGFKFDEAEAGEKEVLKNMQRRQVEVENGIITAEEAQQQEQDEQSVREKFNIKLIDTHDLDGVEGVENGASMQQLLQKMEASSDEEVEANEENELMNEDGTVNRQSVKRKGLEIINSIAAEGGEGMEKLFQVAADSGNVNTATLMDAIKAVQSIEDSIQFNQGIQKLNVNGKMFYYEEVEINDYPQKARFALNNRAEMDRIQDWTGASVGIRGNYVPPGRKPALGSRKLHLYIEADSPAKVTRAKTECISFLENATKGGSYDSDMIKAYTT